MICSFYIYFEKKQITRKHAFYVIDDVSLDEVLGFIKYSFPIFSREYRICKHGLSCYRVPVQTLCNIILKCQSWRSIEMCIMMLLKKLGIFLLTLFRTTSFGSLYENHNNVI